MGKTQAKFSKNSDSRVPNKLYCLIESILKVSKRQTRGIVAFALTFFVHSNLFGQNSSKSAAKLKHNFLKTQIFSSKNQDFFHKTQVPGFIFTWGDRKFAEKKKPV